MYCLSILFFSLILFFSSQKDPFIKKTLDRIAKINSGHLIYRYSIKSPFSQDTITSSLDLLFIRTQYPTFPKCSLILFDTTNKNYAISFYDGITKTFGSNPKLKYSKKGFRKDYYSRLYPFFFDSSLLKFSSNEVDSKLLIQDTLLNNKFATLFYHQAKYKVPDSSYPERFITCFFDDKSLPVSITQVTSALGGNIQYEKYELIDYSLNCYDSIFFYKMFTDNLAILSKQFQSYEQIDIDSLAALHKHNANSITKFHNDSLAPNFTARTFSKDPISLQELIEKNNIILLDFWYNSCTPCQLAMPKLEALYKKYHAKGLEILGLNPVDTNRLAIKKILDKYDITYPILLADTSIASKYEVKGYPSLFLIDKNRNVIFFQEGYRGDLEEKLDRIIREQLH
jgi:thiol-disulfide isomerase/thioredoxin